MNIKQLLPRRLSSWYEIGPIQRAELEQFAQAVLDSRAAAITADGVLVKPGDKVWVIDGVGGSEATTVKPTQAVTDYYLFGQVPVAHSFSSHQALREYQGNA